MNTKHSVSLQSLDAYQWYRRLIPRETIEWVPILADLPIEKLAEYLEVFLENGDSQIVRKLLSLAPNRAIALFWEASSMGYPQLVKYLGLQMNEWQPGFNEALIRASEEGQSEIIHILFELSPYDTPNLDEAWKRAAESGHLETLKVLDAARDLDMGDWVRTIGYQEARRLTQARLLRDLSQVEALGDPELINYVYQRSRMFNEALMR